MSKRNAAARNASDSAALRNSVGFLICTWFDLLDANLTDQADVVERSISEILRVSFLGVVICWNSENAFVVRAETPHGLVERVPVVSLSA